ncbi:MAG: hypothetical protein RJB37_3314 [Pseudomonadota bacterium]
MKINVGGADRILRIVVGLALILLVLTGQIGAWGWLGLDRRGAAGHRAVPDVSAVHGARHEHVPDVAEIEDGRTWRARALQAESCAGSRGDPVRYRGLPPP